MNHRMPCRVLVVLIASLGGCGGDHSSTSISVSATSVTINANAGELVPAAQTIHVTYQGDQAGVGYAPGVAQATWLAVSVVGQTGSTMDVSLQASDTAIAGTRTTTLRFFTSKEDGSDAKFADVQVTCTLTGSLASNPEASQPPASISVSTPAVTFDSEQGAVPPAPQRVHVTFQGADVALGSATPPWLAVSQLARTPTTVDYSLRVVDTTTSGTFTTALQFFVRSANGSQIEFADVVVTSTVFGPFGVTAPSLTFSALGGAAQPADPAAGYVVTIRGDRARWRATAPPWISLGQTAGSGPAALTVTGNPEALTAGAHQGTIEIFDDTSGRLESFSAAITVRAPRPTVGAVSPFAVDVDSRPAALIQQVIVADEIGGTSAAWAVRWSVEAVSAAWLRWSPVSGTSSAPAAVTLSVDPTTLAAMENGRHDTTVVLSWSNAEASGQLTIPVVLDLCLPRADGVAPSLVTANQGGHVYIRGTGFACTPAAPTLLLGTAELAKTIDTDTQIQANVPALPAGRYPLRFDNGLGIELGTAELVVLSPPTLAYQAITAPGNRGRLVYDSERSTVYAVNGLDQSIERYALSGSTWSALTPIIVPDVRDVDLAPGGGSLLVSASNSLGEIDLRAATPSVVERATNPDPFCGGFFADLAVANSGKVFVVFKLGRCTGFTHSYFYDVRTHSLTQTTFLFNGVAAASGDGSRIYLGSNGLSPEPEVVFIFDALSDTTATGTLRANLSAISVSGDASRVILQGADVYSRALSLTGHVASGGGTLASRDSNRAFVYRDDGVAGPRIVVYDLNGALQAGALYPVAKTIALPDSPNTAAGALVQMASTPDDRAVFVSGNARILVVPVN